MSTLEHVGPAGPLVAELEIVCRDGEYRVRPHRGYRTNLLGLGDVRMALPRARWMSDDSMFVELISTDMPFGGSRLWFKCRRCGRRCGVLFREPHTNARAFACRICLAFRYESQLLGRSDLRLGKIARRLAHLDLRTGRTIARPKGMHHRTFDTIKADVQPALRLWSHNDPTVRRFVSALTEIEAAIEADFGQAIRQRHVRSSFRWRS